MRGTEIRRKAIGLAALAMAAGFLPARGAAILTWDSGGMSPTNPADGGGTWDAATTPDWSNGSSDSIWNSADVAAIGNANGAAGTITLGSAVTAAGLNLNAAGSGNYTIAGSNTLTLSSGANITLASGTSTTISAKVAGTSTVITGPGSVYLSNNTNTFASGLTISGGANVNFDNTAELGAATTTVTINGGEITDTKTNGAVTVTAENFVIGAGGATIDVVAPAAGGGGGKFNPNNANSFSGSGTITMTGNGDIQLGQADTAFTGAWIINSGFVESGKSNSLGNASATNTVTINAGGELVGGFTAGAIANPITLNGGTIEEGKALATTMISGAVNVTANSTLRLGDYYDAVNRDMFISGNLTGSGNLVLGNALNSTAGTATQTQVAASGNLLTLSGTNTGYTGTLTVDGGHAVQFGSPIGATTLTTNPSIVANLTATSSATAMPVICINSNTAPPSVNTTNAPTGVFATFNNAYTQAINLGTLYGGGWFLGTDQNGGSFWTSAGGLIPGMDSSGNPLYRLGGGNGGLFIGNPCVTDYNSTSASVQIGSPMLLGNGTIEFGAAMTYTGSTLIANGTLQDKIVNNGIPVGTTITFGSVNSTSGTQYAGTLDLAGFNQTVAGLAVASGLTGTNIAAQTIGNSSSGMSAANSILTVNASAANTFAGTIKDKLGSGTKTLALAVLGSGSLDLTGSNTYTGGTTVGGTLLVDNTTGSATGTGGVTVSTGGVLGGDGIITGLVTLGGTISPGHSPGTITLAGGLTLSDGSILQMDLGTAASDEILITGGTITGSDPGDVTVNVNNAGGLSYGQTYTLMDWTGATPSNVSASDFVLGTSPLAGTFNIVGNQLQLTLAPEPASLSLVLCGALGLSRRRRR